MHEVHKHRHRSQIRTPRAPVGAKNENKNSGKGCMFNKFGFYKWEASFRKVHFTEIGPLEEWENRKCQKRHPRPCPISAAINVIFVLIELE